MYTKPIVSFLTVLFTFNQKEPPKEALFYISNEEIRLKVRLRISSRQELRLP